MKNLNLENMQHEEKLNIQVNVPGLNKIDDIVVKGCDKGDVAFVAQWVRPYYQMWKHCLEGGVTTNNIAFPPEKAIFSRIDDMVGIEFETPDGEFNSMLIFDPKGEKIYARDFSGNVMSGENMAKAVKEGKVQL